MHPQVAVPFIPSADHHPSVVTATPSQNSVADCSSNVTSSFSDGIIHVGCAVQRLSQDKTRRGVQAHSPANAATLDVAMAILPPSTVAKTNGAAASSIIETVETGVVRLRPSRASALQKSTQSLPTVDDAFLSLESFTPCPPVIADSSSSSSTTTEKINNNSLADTVVPLLQNSPSKQQPPPPPDGCIQPSLRGGTQFAGEEAAEQLNTIQKNKKKKKSYTPHHLLTASFSSLLEHLFAVINVPQEVKSNIKSSSTVIVFSCLNLGHLIDFLLESYRQEGGVDLSDCTKQTEIESIRDTVLEAFRQVFPASSSYFETVQVEIQDVAETFLEYSHTTGPVGFQMTSIFLVDLVQLCHEFGIDRSLVDHHHHDSDESNDNCCQPPQKPRSAPRPKGDLSPITEEELSQVDRAEMCARLASFLMSTHSAKLEAAKRRVLELLPLP